MDSNRLEEQKEEKKETKLTGKVQITTSNSMAVNYSSQYTEPSAPKLLSTDPKQVKAK